MQDTPEALADDPLLRRLAEQANSSVAELRQGLDALRTRTRKAREAAVQDRDQWLPALQEAEVKHNQAVAEAGGDVAKLSQERTRLANRRDEVSEQLRRAQGAADQLTPTVERRTELLAQLEAQERAYSQERQKRCEWFFDKSDQQIKASVQAGSNVEAFRRRLEALKRGLTSATQISRRSPSRFDPASSYGPFFGTTYQESQPISPTWLPPLD